jgi:hypothetical protein
MTYAKMKQDTYTRPFSIFASGIMHVQLCLLELRTSVIPAIYSYSVEQIQNCTFSLDFQSFTGESVNKSEMEVKQLLTDIISFVCVSLSSSTVQINESR